MSARSRSESRHRQHCELGRNQLSRTQYQVLFYCIIPDIFLIYAAIYYVYWCNDWFKVIVVWRLYYLQFDMQRLRYFASRKRLRGWVPPPWIFAFPMKFFENISHGYVFLVKKSNGDNEKILSLLHDLENQGQTLFCMTFLISGRKHDTNSILVSILTFSRSRISKMLKKLRDLNGWPWNSRSHTFIVWPFLAPAVFMLQTWSWCRLYHLQCRGSQKT